MADHGFVPLAVKRETREKIRVLAKIHRTTLYGLIEKLIENDEKNLSKNINIDIAAGTEVQK